MYSDVCGFRVAADGDRGQAAEHCREDIKAQSAENRGAHRLSAVSRPQAVRREAEDEGSEAEADEIDEQEEAG